MRRRVGRAETGASRRTPPEVLADEAILQIKVWLQEISPMIGRGVKVPAPFTLREPNAVIHVAMGWEGIHLFRFCLCAGRYGSWELAVSGPAVALPALRPTPRFHESESPRLTGAGRIDQDVNHAVGMTH